jgi:NifU-like protein
MITCFPWTHYSKKLQLRIETPYCLGSFTPEDANARELFLATSTQGSLATGNQISLFWLVDKTDGVIIDSRFQAFGDTVLVGAAEVACELVIGKNYDQARRITAELLDRHVRDKRETPAFPESAADHISLVTDALENCAVACDGIPLAAEYVAPPITGHMVDVVEGGYPGWSTLTLEQKLAVIEQVIAQEVRPYIEMDAGGVSVINLMHDKEVVIAYSGACTDCHSSTGATLSYIQHVLRAKVHPDLDVIPSF